MFSYKNIVIFRVHSQFVKVNLEILFSFSYFQKPCIFKLIAMLKHLLSFLSILNLTSCNTHKTESELVMCFSFLSPFILIQQMADPVVDLVNIWLARPEMILFYFMTYRTWSGREKNEYKPVALRSSVTALQD